MSQVQMAYRPGFVSQTAKVFRPPFDANQPEADRYLVRCVECGAEYVPEIYRLQGQTRIISRVKPCPVCGMARHNGFRCGGQERRISQETTDLVNAGIL